MGEHAMESLLRPAVELYTVGICAGAGALCLHSPWAVALSPEVGAGMALAYTAFGLKRLNEARIVLRYRRNIRRLPRYSLTSRQIPVSGKRLFMGRGFRWTRLHTQRLLEAQTRRWPATSISRPPTSGRDGWNICWRRPRQGCRCCPA